MALLYVTSSCTVVQDQLISPNITPESTECLTNTSYSGNTTVTGTASFYKRKLKNKSGAYVLGDPISTPLPIRFAEVQIVDSSGVIVQCGRTDGSGNIKAVDMTGTLNIPDAAGTYTIKVLARSNVTLGGLPGGKPPVIHHTAVKKDIYSNTVHYISTVITSNGSGNYTASMSAAAREVAISQAEYYLPGGAFNIYNDALSLYSYVGQNTGTANLTCLNNKLDIYWLPGFNPAQYIYPKADPGSLSTLSFYNRGYSELYISGGRQNNLSTQDTDHFDDTVILHELGHYLEDACGSMDSPGGSHYGLYRGDARLMWSEGWGNFTGVHMLRNNISLIYPNIVADTVTSDGWRFYLDTKGYDDTGTGSPSVPFSAAGAMMIRLNMTRAGLVTWPDGPAGPEETVTLKSGATRYYDVADSSTNPGEGLLREISIARSLFKGTNTCSTSIYCSGSNNYQNYWSAFSRLSGMGNSNYSFRSASLFWNRFAALNPPSLAAVDNMLNNDEAQQRNNNSVYDMSGSTPWVPYGIKLIKSDSACALKIKPIVNMGLTSGYADDQRFNSHFYTLDLSLLSGVTSINLQAINTTGTAGINHDLIVYREGYKFDEDCSTYGTDNICTSPQKAISSDMVTYDRSTGNSKTVSLSSLNSLSKYLLVVKSYTMPYSNISVGTEYTYTLTDQSGGYLCPGSY